MTATDELRRLLDERGVEWGAEESELDHVTTWNSNGGQAMFYESKTTNPNLLQVNYYDLTPAQAVEATLGSGIVRCRDCKRFAVDQSDHEYRSGWWCHRWNTDMVKPDGFCAWGERREA